MNFAPNPDFGAGAMFAFLGILGVILSFLPAVLTEAIVLRRLLPNGYALRDSFIMNLVSTALGLAASAYFIMPFAASFTPYYEFDIKPYLILILTSWALSVLVEGAVLTMLRSTPTPQVLRISLVANIVSYGVIVGGLLLMGPYSLFSMGGWSNLYIILIILLGMILWEGKLYPEESSASGTGRDAKQLMVWGLTSLLGFLMGWVLATPLIHIVSEFGRIAFGATFGVLFGTMGGVMQHLFLRRYMRHAGWWILASAVGWGIGWTVAWSIILLGCRPDTMTFCDEILEFLGGGNPGALFAIGWTIGAAVAGAMQWGILRRLTPRAGRWVLASGGGGIAAGIIYWVAGSQAWWPRVDPLGLFGFFGSGLGIWLRPDVILACLVYAAITGPVLMRLLRGSQVESVTLVA